MGLLLSKFKDKPSTRDTLEKIEQELQNIEERRWDKIKREQFIVQILSFLPIAILIAIVCILIYPSDSSWRDKLILCVPIGIINLILWVSKRIVQWYSRWSLDNEEARLRKLRKEKKKILEMVCETESYRVATELLEKYDPKQLRRREKNVDTPTTPHNQTLTKFTASPARSPAHQNQRSSQHISSPMSHNQSISFPVQTFVQPAPTPAPTPAPPPPTPITKSAVMKNNQVAQANTSIMNASTTATVATSSVQGRPVRPVLSRDRTYFEKVVDWVVGDGPDNRFALICRYCYGHNGMCLPEEHETINFRCCYCYNLNMATQRRQLHDQLQSDREKSSDATIASTTKSAGTDSTITTSTITTKDTQSNSRPAGESRKEKSKKSRSKTPSEDIVEDKNGEKNIEDKKVEENITDNQKAKEVEEPIKEVDATSEGSK